LSPEEQDLAISRATRLLVRERRRLALWTPVCVGIGVWLYFLAPFEPSGWTNAIALSAPLLLLAYAARGRRIVTGVVAIALLLAAIGLAAASLRARVVAAPVLAEAADLTVEGLVEEISRSRNGAVRVLLDEVAIFGLSRNETPRKVRVTLLGGDLGREVRVGERISVFANLSPPGGAVEPGAFDFRQWAWFRSLDAVGFARGAVVSVEPQGSGSWRERLWRNVQSLRYDLSRAIQTRIPGEAGAFSSAIITGDRSGVSNGALQALRDSNLAHLLAISGLHMGLLTALVFGLVRLMIALVPPVALRVPSKKAAAVIALAAAAAYLVMSGASIATQRAFIMVAVALCAILIDRPAITLRALAAAALIILLTRPESLMDAGFQMSFADRRPRHRPLRGGELQPRLQLRADGQPHGGADDGASG
jgi:competence protein ComEC